MTAVSHSRKNISCSPKPEIGRILSKGLSGSEMAEIAGITKQGISEYLKRSGLIEKWKKAKRAKKEKNNTQESIAKEKLDSEREYFLQILNQHRYSRLQSESWATQNIVEYIRSYKSINKLRNNSQKYFQDVARVFQNYRNAVDEGKKATLSELLEGTKFKFPSQSREMLKRVGLEPLTWTYKRGEITGTQEKQIQLSYHTDFTAKDISYYTSVHSRVIIARFSELEGNRNREQKLIKMTNKSNLTYHLLSEVFEAIDLGFSLDEIAQLTETKTDSIEYALSQRDSLEPIIISELSKIFPERDIRVGYL